ncbi:MAG: hypothetical protein RLZ23_963, partial [Actinomycetota bacterium]
MIYCLKHLLSCAKLQSAPWVSVTTTFKSWVEQLSTVEISPKCAQVKVRLSLQLFLLISIVATLPSYLNALAGRGVHVVTVNDYLAERDSEWMGRIHRFLGLSVGVILNSMTPAERRTAYLSDITYGTNNEFGFDYLRDNMAWSLEDCVQRDHFFAVVDEVDSILIDEARTPLIISGPADKATKWYVEFANIATKLQRDVHYEVDEKKKTIGILEDGVTKVEELLK